MLSRLLIATFGCTLAVNATLLRVEVADRSEVLSGQPFGRTGAYERLHGKAYFAVDPAAAVNRRIVDLDRTPRSRTGLVEFAADLYILRPKDAAKGNRTILFEPPNRGGKGLLSMFNRATASPDPHTAEHFGDRLLMEAGYTLVWLGWQHDVPLRAGAMRLYAPVAKGVTGWVRSEFTPDKPTVRFSLGDSNHIAYPVTDPEKVTLTVRDSINGPRQRLDRTLWSIGNGTEITLSTPAAPGSIYEAVYESADPAIAGLGLAAVRDAISFLKYGGSHDATFPEQHKHAIAFGASQSAMMLKAMVYEGFNADERGRQVFDGIFSHVAGGRRSTFQRFTQHSRTAGPLRDASFSTTDQFPFTDLSITDHETGISDGLLSLAAKQRVVPKIIYTNSSYEYWGSSGALTHTSVDGMNDLACPETSRMYLFTGGQHGPASLGNPAGRAQNLPNFNDYRWMNRALLQRLYEWVAEGKEPPASEYPMLKSKTLVPIHAYSFPKVPNVSTPRAPHISERLEFGPSYREAGVIASEPPKRGQPFPALVPQADRDGIDLAGVRMPWVAVPIGTFTGWNLRAASIGAPKELLGQTGSFLPFPRTKAAREHSEDPRASLEERYKGEADYLERIDVAARSLAKRGFLLERDIQPVVITARRYWRWATQAD